MVSFQQLFTTHSHSPLSVKVVVVYMQHDTVYGEKLSHIVIVACDGGETGRDDGWMRLSGYLFRNHRIGIFCGIEFGEADSEE